MSAYPAFHRLIELLMLLQQGPHSTREIIERLATHYGGIVWAREKLQEDLRELREAGFTIRYHAGSRRYHLESSPLLPPFSDDELLLLTRLHASIEFQHPLAPALTKLIEKLAAGLPPERWARVEQPVPISGLLRILTDIHELQPLLAELDAALRGQGHQIAFDYQPAGEAGYQEQNPVDPLQIELIDGHLFLVAYSYQLRLLVEYRLDRFRPTSLQLLPTPVTTERDIYPLHIRYWLAPLVAQGGISARFADQRIIVQHPDGSVEIEARARSSFRVIRTLLRYGPNAKLLAPPDLRTAFRGELLRTLSHYEV